MEGCLDRLIDLTQWKLTIEIEPCVEAASYLFPSVVNREAACAGAPGPPDGDNPPPLQGKYTFLVDN
ncbi:hypothetical protein EVAR_27373_1 [Eumeta japonica]|uniref:Uncharacterized protein n=1 Tax=Eumeta variegata TaxID=151549 RepID=A0A4C1X570_EUMVA|nr:hypothetical protein EVAR_27373_1 [Eumeta japonica]